MRKCTRSIVGRFLLAGVVVMVTQLSTRAVVLYSYSADPDSDVLTPAPDPLTAAGGSWSLTGGGATQASVTTLPGTETAAGPAYWEVTDGTTTGSKGYNVTGVAGSAVANALSSSGGWSVTFTLKVLASANPTLTPPSYNVPTVVDIRNGRRIYDLAFVNNGTDEGVYLTPAGMTFNNAHKIMDLDLDAVICH